MPVVFMRRYFLDDKIFPAQCEALFNCARAYVYSKKIESFINDLDGAVENFWKHNHYSNMLLFVTEWCHVFGNYKHSKIHWRRVAPKQGKCIDGNVINNFGFEESVRSKLTEANNMSFNSLRKYSGTVIRFRNSYAAHRDIENYTQFPLRDQAIAIAAAYLDWLIDEVLWSGQPTLRELMVDFSTEADRATAHLT